MFFIIKNVFIMKNLTDFRKTVETGVDPRLHTEHLVQKHRDLLVWKEAIWSLTKKKKTRSQERKANRIITLDDKNSKKVEL